MGLLFKIALGFGLAMLCIWLFAVLPDINMTLFGLDFTTMTESNLWFARLILLFFAFLFMFWGVLDFE